MWRGGRGVNCLGPDSASPALHKYERAVQQNHGKKFPLPTRKRSLLKNALFRVVHVLNMHFNQGHVILGLLAHCFSCCLLPLTV